MENAGYTIIRSIRLDTGDPDSGLTIVLGQGGSNKPCPYVTWEVTNNNYYWGHYFTNERDAIIDLIDRAINILQGVKNNWKGSD